MTKDDIQEILNDWWDCRLNDSQAARALGLTFEQFQAAVKPAGGWADNVLAVRRANEQADSGEGER